MADMMNRNRMSSFSSRPMPRGEIRPAPEKPCVENCQRLKRKLQTIDFAIIETALYLDAYPNCRHALDHYHKLIAERESIADMIDEKCGPICIGDNKSRTEWNWVDGPWPWEADANI